MGYPCSEQVHEGLGLAEKSILTPLTLAGIASKYRDAFRSADTRPAPVLW
jgi:hypothetical protein